MTRLDQIRERLQHAQQMQMLNFKVFYEPDISYLLGEVGKLQKTLSNLRDIVLDDVPHQYQNRLLEILNDTVS